MPQFRHQWGGTGVAVAGSAEFKMLVGRETLGARLGIFPRTCRAPWRNRVSRRHSDGMVARIDRERFTSISKRRLIDGSDV